MSLLWLSSSAEDIFRVQSAKKLPQWDRESVKSVTVMRQRWKCNNRKLQFVFDGDSFRSCASRISLFDIHVLLNNGDARSLVSPRYILRCSSPPFQVSMPCSQSSIILCFLLCLGLRNEITRVDNNRIAMSEPSEPGQSSTESERKRNF